MKARLLGALLALSAATALAQGTVYFSNRHGTDSYGFHLNVPVYHWDGTRLLSGSQYMAELLVGTSQRDVTNSVGLAPFLFGLDAGYFDGGVVTINGIPGGSNAWFQVRFWNTGFGSTFETAQRFVSRVNWGDVLGSSTACPVTLGDPTASPAADLSCLAGQSLRLNSTLSGHWPVPLDIVVSPNTVLLKWPSSAGFILESTTNFASRVWSRALPAPLVTNNYQCTVTFPNNGASQFFRLTAP